MYNNSLKPTVTRVTPFAEKAKPAPRYGSLVPPLYGLINMGDDRYVFNYLLETARD